MSLQKLQLVDPLKYSGWDDIVVETGDYTFFHSAAWARVLSDAYRYIPNYFAIIENQKLLALIPIMLVKSFLNGKRGVSLPFSDYCGPIVDPDIDPLEIMDFLKDFLQNSGWRYCEFRGGRACFPETEEATTYVDHIITLSNDEAAVYANFRRTTKQNIQRAVKNGVEYRFSRSLESMREYFRLHCKTRKLKGLPPPPFKFFKMVHKHIIAKKKGFIVLGAIEGKIIAAIICFHLGDKAIVKYSASDGDYSDLRAGHLIFWEAIKRYCRDGITQLSFGRTEPQNKGLRFFKTGWGAQEAEIKYYRYDIQKDCCTLDCIQTTGWYNYFFKKMPLCALKMFGSLFYRQYG